MEGNVGAAHARFRAASHGLCVARHPRFGMADDMMSLGKPPSTRLQKHKSRSTADRMTRHTCTATSPSPCTSDPTHVHSPNSTRPIMMLSYECPFVAEVEVKVDADVGDPDPLRLMVVYAASNSSSTSHLHLISQMNGHVLLSPFTLHCSSLAIVGVSKILRRSHKPSWGVMGVLDHAAELGTTSSMRIRCR